MEVFAKEMAMGINTEEDLSEISHILTKTFIEAALAEALKTLKTFSEG